MKKKKLMINTREEKTIATEKKWTEDLWSVFESKSFDGAIELLKNHKTTPVSKDFHDDLTSDVLFWGLKNTPNHPWLWALFLEVSEQPQRIFDIMHTSLQTNQSFIWEEKLFSEMFKQFAPARQRHLLNTSTDDASKHLWESLSDESKRALWDTGFFVSKSPSLFQTYLHQSAYLLPSSYLSVIEQANQALRQEWWSFLSENNSFVGYWEQWIKENYDSHLKSCLIKNDLVSFGRLLEEKSNPISLTDAMRHLYVWLDAQTAIKEDESSRPRLKNHPGYYKFPSQSFDFLIEAILSNMSSDAKEKLTKNTKPLLTSSEKMPKMFLPPKPELIVRHLRVHLEKLKVIAKPAL